MQNPNDDTEWNDILRKHKVIPEKEKEVSEDDIINMVEATVKEKQVEVGGGQKKSIDDLDLDELDLLEDEEDERVLEEYRRKRIAELTALAEKSKFGSLLEITAQDYVQEVNKAGTDVWVVLHLYRPGIPLCSLINQHLTTLAKKFPSVKFIKSISVTCIPNYPDKNLPTVFVYFEGDLKSQLIGPEHFKHADISVDELEWILSRTGAVKSSILENPRPKARDVLFSNLGVDPSHDDW